MAKQFSLPLSEKVARKNTTQRALDITLLFLLLSLLLYRLLSVSNHGFVWLLAFLCESYFTFNWFLIVNCKWNPVDFITYPQNLEKRFPELPPVDMFVTTADPVLEPPLITINTVLSLLAVDYPSEKLACYLSDDGCSPLTFYSLVEASKFAKLWVPFCNKYNVQVRAPFRYFLDDPVSSNLAGANSEFKQEWKKMKAEYEELCLKIEAASRKSVPCDLTGEFAVFSNVGRSNHPTIIKIVGESKQSFPDDVPRLVYISREKRPKHPHHFKAGAMNVLSRVSGLMTNAPYMLNVDCDMFANNPQVVRQAMCQLLDSKSEREIGFVQFPQSFYDGPKDDPYGNQLVVLYEYMGRGIAGLQGISYSGTGCFHRRKVIYGQWPEDVENQARNHTSINGKLVDNEVLIKVFGKSKRFSESAAYALNGKKGFSSKLPDSLDEAFHVASCDYEFGTSWGTKIGWIYGSMTEDVMTGLMIHKKGWKSTLPMPKPKGFLGCAPSGGPAAMTQQKRWATGLFEILVSRNSPIFAFLCGKLQFRMLLFYLWFLSWGLFSIPELCYAALPAYCIIANSQFLPKVQDPAILIPVAIFVIYNLLTIREYLKAGMSIRAWWNFMKMGRITRTSAYLLASLTVVLKLLGLSETVFEVTQKDQSNSDGDIETNKDAIKFTFDESPLFVPGTTLLLVQLTALLSFSVGLRPLAHDVGHGLGLGEVFCSLWLVLCYLPFLKGLFRSGKYGIPKSTIFKSTSLALVFVLLCIKLG
ncbi:Cellulose synthase [Corchorus olitorius]|uniref:Cellulose synthase n=1 Tax=Corchorus olitorius TaxID=93759 RepID=A0A1R3J2B3_9ROSI|nr:Cellulose synthase [Corchorus olitorius]